MLRVLFLILLIITALSDNELTKKSKNCYGGVDKFIFGEGDTSYSNSIASDYVSSIAPIVFIKTHKTGSSTILSIIQRIADIRDLKVMVPVDLVHLGWPKSFPGETGNHYRRGQVDVICNHANFNKPSMDKYMRTGKKAFYLTVLREPLSAAISAYNFYATRTIKKGVKWKDHIERFKHVKSINTKMSSVFINPQAHDLGWYERFDSSTRFDHNRIRIDQYINYLDKNLDLVIVLDKFDKGLVLLSHMLNVSINEMAYLPQRAHSNSSWYFRPEESLHSEIYKLNEVDTAIYKHFSRKFNRLWDDFENLGRNVTFSSGATLNDGVLQFHSSVADQEGTLLALNKKLFEQCGQDAHANRNNVSELVSIDRPQCHPAWNLDERNYGKHFENKESQYLLRYAATRDLSVAPNLNPYGGIEDFVAGKHSPTRTHTASIPMLPPLVMLKNGAAPAESSSLVNVMLRMADLRKLQVLHENVYNLNGRNLYVQSLGKLCNTDHSNDIDGSYNYNADMIITQTAHNRKRLNSYLVDELDVGKFYLTVLKDPRKVAEEVFDAHKHCAKDPHLNSSNHLRIIEQLKLGLTNFDCNLKAYYNCSESIRDKDTASLLSARNPQSAAFGWYHMLPIVRPQQQNCTVTGMTLTGELTNKCVSSELPGFNALSCLSSDLSTPFTDDVRYDLNFENEKAHISHFIRRIDRSIDLVILAEDMDRGLVLLSHMLNLSLSEVLHLRNYTVASYQIAIADSSNNDNRESSSSSTSQDVLLSPYQADAELYTFYVKKFNNLWDETNRVITEANSLAELRAPGNAPERHTRLLTLNEKLSIYKELMTDLELKCSDHALKRTDATASERHCHPSLYIDELSYYHHFQSNPQYKCNIGSG